MSDTKIEEICGNIRKLISEIMTKHECSQGEINNLLKSGKKTVEELQEEHKEEYQRILSEVKQRCVENNELFCSLIEELLKKWGALYVNLQEKDCIIIKNNNLIFLLSDKITKIINEWQVDPFYIVNKDFLNFFLTRNQREDLYLFLFLMYGNSIDDTKHK